MTPLPANLRPTTLEEALGVIEHLLVQIGELEERLRQSLQNSSRPPSSGAPAADRPAKRPPWPPPGRATASYPNMYAMDRPDPLYFRQSPSSRGLNGYRIRW